MLLQSMGIVVALSFRAIRFRPSELLSNDGLDVAGHVMCSVVIEVPIQLFGADLLTHLRFMKLKLGAIRLMFLKQRESPVT